MCLEFFSTKYNSNRLRSEGYLANDQKNYHMNKWFYPKINVNISYLLD